MSGVAGACMAIGIRYAGSCHAAASALLTHKLKAFVLLKARVDRLKPRVSPHFLEGIIGTLALSLAVVMAGSGHTATLSLLRGDAANLRCTRSP